ncbi:unnamed protein product [Nezara viridula]|uniref:Uncharacterized protein n=1 Tax=Nezara viridula TaxID=85310 RepID=A0A9P0EET9_NEZVI|nr:unnamed protein product [Nezara viridula]
MAAPIRATKASNNSTKLPTAVLKPSLSFTHRLQYQFYSFIFNHLSHLYQNICIKSTQQYLPKISLRLDS